MSADLLAEFGTGVTSSTAEERPNRSQQQHTSANSPFPDLESFGPVVSTNQSYNLNDRGSKASGVTEGSLNENLWRRDDQGAEVLFDASMEDAPPNGDDDDWGEFESADPVAENKLLDVEVDDPVSSTARNNAKPVNVSQTSALLDLLSLDDTASPTDKTLTVSAPPSQQPPQTSSTSFFSDPILQQQNTLAQSSEEQLDDDWGDFVDGPEESHQATPGQAETGKANPPSLTRPDQIRHTAEPTNKARNQSSQPDVRPTNIPPPSVLLQLFPSVLEEFREKGTKARRDPDLASHLASTLKVAARIIAGRALRWKRDTILSQSTKIGPARSGKAGGMKLSSVSKSESVKEEQEAVGVLEAWRRHAAFFNSVILSSGGRPVPVITDKTRIETAGPSQGALKASHACALCGLKRDERLPKIDENVEDSFGEWWVEHWGHTDCKRFWDENSKRLRQR
ncbi:hypothetical protein VTN77DRAFT_39 [Rasamsonia byssochlamydoides]|uniref:uncharacterized protein n=1 Tax=Rasamsonia byssochlamydoides TaxID=89139 RepID=UPI0037424883